MSTEVKNKVNEILVAHNLDFRIQKDQLVTKASMLDILIGEMGMSQESAIELLVKRGISTPYYALTNDKSGEVLNSVKEGYTVSQNDEIVELVLRGMEGFGELSVSKAGSLNGGRKVFIQLAIEGMSLVGSENIKRYVTIIDSNDGSTGLSVGIGELVMSCQNQFFRFYKNGQSKFRHTASLTQRVKELPQLIELALGESLKLTETYRQFQSTKVSRKLADEMVKHILGFDRSMSIKEGAEMSTRSLNAMDTLYNHIEKETNQKGLNLFGLFSGVTSWTTHEKSAPRRENGREESIMTGTNYRTNEQGLEFALNKLGLVMA